MDVVQLLLANIESVPRNFFQRFTLLFKSNLAFFHRCIPSQFCFPQKNGLYFSFFKICPVCWPGFWCQRRSYLLQWCYPRCHLQGTGFIYHSGIHPHTISTGQIFIHSFISHIFIHHSSFSQSNIYSFIYHSLFHP